MRIAFVTTMRGFPWGGSEFLWSDAAYLAVQDHHDVLIVTYDWPIPHPKLERLALAGALIVKRKLPSPSSILRRIVRYFKQKTKAANSINPWLREIIKFKPGIICVSQGGAYDALFDEQIAHLLNINVIPKFFIIHLANDSQHLTLEQRDVLRKQFEQASGIGFVSEANRRSLERQIGARIKNSFILRNPVNLRSTECVPWPESIPTVFCSVARLDVRFKGQDILLETLSSQQWKNRNWLCRLYGEGPDLHYLKELAKHYQIENRIQFMGHVDDIREIWANAHLLVLPSRSEGTPIALIEAMLCGRPAVVTDVGGNTEWIYEGESGFTAEGSTVKSFGSALERAWLARDKWKQLGANAHHYSAAHIDPNPGETLLQTLCVHVSMPFETSVRTEVKS